MSGSDKWTKPRSQPCFNRLEVVHVKDETSPFYNWTGEIGYSFFVGDSWRYECHVEARGGGGARLTLTFAESQLSL